MSLAILVYYFCRMKSITIQQVKTEKDIQQQSSSENGEAAYDEIKEKTFSLLPQKIATISNKYVGYPNNEQTRDKIKFAILSQFGNAIDNLHCYRDDLDVIVKNRDIDELAEKCNSYEEYKMKCAIISGDLPAISESEFWKRHDPNNKYLLDVHIQVKPLKCFQRISLDFAVENSL